MFSAPWICPMMTSPPAAGTRDTATDAASVRRPLAPAVKLVRLFSSVLGCSEFGVLAPQTGAQNRRLPSGCRTSHGGKTTAGVMLAASPVGPVSGRISFQPVRSIDRLGVGLGATGTTLGVNCTDTPRRAAKPNHNPPASNTRITLEIPRRTIAVRRPWDLRTASPRRTGAAEDAGVARPPHRAQLVTAGSALNPSIQESGGDAPSWRSTVTPVGQATLSAAFSPCPGGTASNRVGVQLWEPWLPTVPSVSDCTTNRATPLVPGASSSPRPVSIGWNSGYSGPFGSAGPRSTTAGDPRSTHGCREVLVKISGRLPCPWPSSVRAPSRADSWSESQVGPVGAAA